MMCLGERACGSLPGQRKPPPPEYRSGIYKDPPGAGTTANDCPCDTRAAVAFLPAVVSKVRQNASVTDGTSKTS